MLVLIKVIKRISPWKRNVGKGRKCRLRNARAWKSMTASATRLPQISEAVEPSAGLTEETLTTGSRSITSARKTRTNSDRAGTGRKRASDSSKGREKRNNSATGVRYNATLAKGKKSERSPKRKEWTELGRNVEGKKSAGARSDDTPPETVSPPTTPDAGETRSTSTDYYDTDFESDASSDVDADGLHAYRVGCQVLGVTALPRAISQWSGPTINLNYRNLGPAGAKALTSALLVNPHVTRLELQENRLGGIGGMYVATYLRENIFITHLNLAQNNLGSMGAMAIAEILQNNRTLEYLDLSDNNFRDSDGDHLARAIEMAEQLKSLNLSHNAFSEDGATRIGRAIGRNDSLQNLEFSWNQLRRKGAGAICAGVKRNTNMNVLDISWNGLGYEGSIGIGEMLRANEYLRELDISSNRINWEGASLVSKGLSLNCSLETLKIGKNPLTMTGCKDILDAICSNPSSSVKFLGLEDIPVNKEITSMIESLRGRQVLEVAHGAFVDSVDVIGRRKDVKKDPLQMLMDFLTARGIRPVDLFRSLKQDDKNMVNKDAFLQGLQNVKVPMHQREIEGILDSLDTGDDGKISFNLLMKGVKDQIKVNREEEKRRMDQEDKFNQERKRLMALTPPNEKRSKKTRATESRDSRVDAVWSDDDWTDNESDDIWQDSQNFSENCVDSRSVTPAPDKDRQRCLVKDTFSLPGISSNSNHAELSKSRSQITSSKYVPKKRKQKTSLLESQRIYKERFQKDYKTDPGDFRQSTLQNLHGNNNRSKKPQRLLPLPGRPSELPSRGSLARPDQVPASKSLDSWSDFATSDSTLPSAMFSQSLSLKKYRSPRLMPLEEREDSLKTMESEERHSELGLVSP